MQILDLTDQHRSLHLHCLADWSDDLFTDGRRVSNGPPLTYEKIGKLDRTPGAPAEAVRTKEKVVTHVAVPSMQ